MRSQSEKKTRAIFFTTDYGFLVPTLVAAQQVQKQSDVTEIADVLVYLVDVSEDATKEISSAFPDIKFFNISSERYELPEGATFHLTHVPRSTLARLAVASDLPEQYEHLVYLDGDVQVVGSILPLVRHDVADGSILASCDRLYIVWPEKRKHVDKLHTYLTQLGMADPYDYFNAGVLAARRSTWISLAADALRYIGEHSAACLYHDQSAMNAVSLGRREVLSPKYNFVSGYADVGATDYVDPSIIHFTGGSKPWFSMAAPWRGRFKHHYDEILVTNPWLRKYHALKPENEVIKDDHAANLAILLIRVILPWIAMGRRKRIKRYLTQTQFAVS